MNRGLSRPHLYTLDRGIRGRSGEESGLEIGLMVTACNHRKYNTFSLNPRAIRIAGNCSARPLWTQTLAHASVALSALAGASGWFGPCCGEVLPVLAQRSANVFSLLVGQVGVVECLIEIGLTVLIAGAVLVASVVLSANAVAIRQIGRRIGPGNRPYGDGV